MSDGGAADPPIIGITGPIACGKSTVAAMLGELGGTVVDADELARRATAPGEPALAAIRERFGEDVFATRGVLVQVPLDGVASRREDHRAAGLDLCRAAGATITTMETVVFDWLRVAGTDTFKRLSKLIR